MLTTILLSALLVMMDQLSKILVVGFLKERGSVEIVPGVLEFRYVENRGAAFSLLAGRQGFLIVVTAIALLACAYVLLFKKPKRRMDYYGLLLIFSGGLGNLIDRILNQYVVDFINFTFVNFAVFNLADIFVTAGFALLLVSALRQEIQGRKNKQSIPPQQ